MERSDTLSRLGEQMKMEHDRREFIKLLSVGGVVFASGLAGCGASANNQSPRPTPVPGATRPTPSDFVFLQITDTHWGYQGPANPEADVTLRQAVLLINASPVTPDFVVFTGDLTHTTEDRVERSRRMSEFRTIVSTLKVKNQKFLPGEHDAAPDQAATYRELFGPTHYAFVHKGVHFIALDNVSLPGSMLGQAQLDWLQAQVPRVPGDAPLVIFAHRPLFDLYPQWDWTTQDGNAALEILSQHPNVTVFYGHIHQEHHQRTGSIVHHSARSLIFPQPPPGSVAKRAPLAWEASSRDHGLGYRSVAVAGTQPLPTEIAYQAPEVHPA